MPSEIDTIMATARAASEGYAVHIGCLGEVDGAGQCEACGEFLERDAILDPDDDPDVDGVLEALDVTFGQLTAERSLREALETQLRAMERERDEGVARSVDAVREVASLKAADLESQLTRAKAEGAREALERALEELCTTTSAHLPERRVAIDIVRSVAARLAGEETKS